MRRLFEHAAVVAVALCIGCPGVASAYRIRALVSSSGVTPATGIQSTGMSHHGTVGQPLVGRTAGTIFATTGGFWPGGGAVTVDVEAPEQGEAGGLPGRLEFSGPAPNPSRGDVTFALSLPVEGRVRVVILDIQGRAVGHTGKGTLRPGRYRIGWDGRRHPAGVYLARLIVDGHPVATRRLVLIR